MVYILVLNWNNAGDTIGCLESLKDLTYSNYHLLVIDNGSSDDSVQQIKTAHSHVEVIETGKNLGFAGGNNVGIRRALEEDADYIWLLNNDTTVEPDSLELMVSKLGSSAKAGILGCTIHEAEDPESVQVYGGGRLNRLTAQLRPYRDPPEGTDPFDYIAGTSLLVQPEVFEEVGLLDDRYFMYWEDLEFSQRVKRAGYRLGYEHQAVIYHKEHGSSENASSQREYLYTKGTVRYFTEYEHIWPLGLATAFVGKIVRRLLAGRSETIPAIVRGFKDGMKEYYADS